VRGKRVEEEEVSARGKRVEVDEDEVSERGTRVRMDEKEVCAKGKGGGGGEWEGKEGARGQGVRGERVENEVSASGKRLEEEEEVSVRGKWRRGR